LSHIRIPIAAAFALLLFGTAGARAQSTDEQYDGPSLLKKILPWEKGRSLCYASNGPPVTYPLDDIPARKKPRTLAMRKLTLQITSEKHDDDNDTKPPTPGRFYYRFGMVGEVVGTKRRLIAAGECTSSDMNGFGCPVECDGGGVSFEPLADSESILMRVSRRFRMTWGCSDEDGRSEVLRDDPALPAVRFDKADAKACRVVERAFKRRR
jgi:hypothetical protein